MLTYAPQSTNSAYGQLLVRVDDYHNIDGMMPKVLDFIEQAYPRGTG